MLRRPARGPRARGHPLSKPLRFGGQSLALLLGCNPGSGSAPAKVDSSTGAGTADGSGPKLDLGGGTTTTTGGSTTTTGATTTGLTASGTTAGTTGGPCTATDGGPLASATIPTTLAETGLYEDAQAKIIASYALEFAPQFVLWSDAAVKQRWLYIPDCDVVDTSDMDVWQLPPGSRAWKQFSFDGVPIETRMIHRFGSGQYDFVFAAYRWNAAGTVATYVPDGVEDAGPDGYDIPSETQCLKCHGNGEQTFGGVPGRYLGVDAIQLSHTGPGLTLQALIDDDRLSDPPVAPFTVPGEAEDQQALGYLHANCGHCHNDLGTGVWQVDFHMRLHVDDAAVMETDTWVTGMGVALQRWEHPEITTRIVPGDPDMSATWVRQTIRTLPDQMPPLGTEKVHDDGVATLRLWIEGLP